MIHIDSKYIAIVGAQLRNFKKKKPNLYNCSCPICGDSSKKKTKARGYFYEYKNSAFYKCHNCHASMSFDVFLKNYCVALHDSYALEKFSERSTATPSKSILDIKPKVAFVKRVDTGLNELAAKISTLPDEHYAKTYLRNRLIPDSVLDTLYFTQDFAKLALNLFPNTTSSLHKDDARIVIPFYNKNKQLVGMQGRSLTADNALRYITIKADSEDSLIFGLERFDDTLPGYVVEGPIDSMFIPNCIATANSNLESACVRVSSNLTLIYDNEPKNKEIVKLMQNSIANNRSICIWPKTINKKDINDMILSGIAQKELLNIIAARTYSGLKAMLEFNQWKRGY